MRLVTLLRKLKMPVLMPRRAFSGVQLSVGLVDLSPLFSSYSVWYAISKSSCWASLLTLPARCRHSLLIRFSTTFCSSLRRDPRQRWSHLHEHNLHCGPLV